MNPLRDIVFLSIFMSILGVTALYLFVSAENEHFVVAELSLLQNPVPEESKSFASREDGFGERKMEYSIRKLLEHESQAPSEPISHPVNSNRGIGWLLLFLGISVFFFLAYFLGRKARMFAKEDEIRKTQRRAQIKTIPLKSAKVVDVKPEESHSELFFFVEDDEAFKFDDLLEAAAELKAQLPCSSLYKVILKSGAVYTVKRLKKLQGSFEEFGHTMTRIGEIKHPNILLLVGYNSTPEGKLLIYKYQNNGSLFDLLDDHMKGKKVFPWNLRLYIAWGIARGLDFIHRSSENKSEIIPHGNLKPSNIILGDNMEALISDYGLSKFLDLDGICLYSSARYTAPEKHISEKGDVYSFGVMLLELLTGRWWRTAE
ncbi:hypothetical protein MLD38_040777 [Melastoma candidum]|nr:hypothetical protein MLD38_040777 [Melastoma candidum]